jgi:hypothetical protein
MTQALPLVPAAASVVSSVVSAAVSAAVSEAASVVSLELHEVRSSAAAAVPARATKSFFFICFLPQRVFLAQ